MQLVVKDSTEWLHEVVVEMMEKRWSKEMIQILESKNGQAQLLQMSVQTSV
jgi:hypothetical protein